SLGLCPLPTTIRSYVLPPCVGPRSRPLYASASNLLRTIHKPSWRSVWTGRGASVKNCSPMGPPVCTSTPSTARWRHSAFLPGCRKVAWRGYYLHMSLLLPEERADKSTTTRIGRKRSQGSNCPEHRSPYGLLRSATSGRGMRFPLDTVHLLLYKPHCGNDGLSTMEGGAQCHAHVGMFWRPGLSP